jgi:hypothetical protein
MGWECGLEAEYSCSMYKHISPSPKNGEKKENLSDHILTKWSNNGTNCHHLSSAVMLWEGINILAKNV